jgi:hypothetical protein
MTLGVAEPRDAPNNSMRLREECPASPGGNLTRWRVNLGAGSGACRAGAASNWQPAATAHPARVQHNESIATAGAREAREAPARKIRGGICAARSAGSLPQHRGCTARRAGLPPRHVRDGHRAQPLPLRGARRCAAAPRSRCCNPGAPRVPHRAFRLCCKQPQPAARPQVHSASRAQMHARRCTPTTIAVVY